MKTLNKDTILERQKLELEVLETAFEIQKRTDKYIIGTIILVMILTLFAAPLMAQKTTRTDISAGKNARIERVITNYGERIDTVFYMYGYNERYSSIVDIVSIKIGTPSEINELLIECMKFLPEAKGSSMVYEGNSIFVSGYGPIMLFGTGNDRNGYVTLGKPAIIKLQTGLKPYLQ